MGADHFGDLLLDRKDWIERCHGILENHRHLLPADAAHIAVILFQQILSVQLDGSIRHHTGWAWDEAENSQSRGRLAGTGFPDKAKRLALFNFQLQPVDRVNDTVAGAEFNGKVLNTQNIVRVAFTHIVTSYFRRGSSASLRPSPRRFNARTVNMMTSPGMTER